MLILVDLDGVTVDFATTVCEEHNKETGDCLTAEDIDDWELPKFGIKKETWQKPGFFYALKPYDGAIEGLALAHKNGHKLWIVTDAGGVDFVEEDKARWVRENLPFVRGIIFTDQKHELPGDLLIDDAPKYLEAYPGTTVKINRPYNRHVVADYAFDSLAEALKELA